MFDARFEFDKNHEMFEEKEDADGRCWTNEGLEFDAIDMQEEEEGFDIKMFNREEDFLQVDAGSELDSIIDMFEDKVDAEF